MKIIRLIIFCSLLFNLSVYSQYWIRKANFPEHSYLPFSFVINDTAYVGINGSRDIWKYDQAGDNWVQLDSFPGNKRYGGFSFVINNKAYISGGEPVDMGVYTNDLGA